MTELYPYGQLLPERAAVSETLSANIDLDRHGELDYQWQISNDNGSTWTSLHHKRDRIEIKDSTNVIHSSEWDIMRISISRDSCVFPPYRSITGRTSWSREDIYDDLTENWCGSKREWKYTNGAYAWVESGLFDLMPATKYPKIEAGEFADYVNFETNMPNSMRFNTGYHDAYLVLTRLVDDQQFASSQVDINSSFEGSELRLVITDHANAESFTSNEVAIRTDQGDAVFTVEEPRALETELTAILQLVDPDGSDSYLYSWQVLAESGE